MKKRIVLYALIILLGVICATWKDIWAKESTETIMAATLFVSVLSMFFTSYITIESAIELRLERRKKLFSNYCERFSNDQSIRKVAEWLMKVSEYDSNSSINKMYPKELQQNDNKTEVPTLFEKERFFDFLIELNIQIKNKQIEKDDARKIFSYYAVLFDKILKSDDISNNHKRDCSEFLELL